LTAHNRKLTTVTFSLDGTEYQAQLKSWTMNNNTDDATVFFVYSPGDEFAEPADPSWSLDVSFYADWRSGGVGDFLMAHDEEDVALVLDHHPDIPGEHVRWSGTIHLKAPNVGGDVRDTETIDTTLTFVGKPLYERIG
jgi:hypothetical protein